MADVQDVAAYIIAKAGGMSTMKLQKLVYYCQAWHLVWVGERLFPERIEAWANGPVAPALFNKHRGQFSVMSWPAGDPEALEPFEAGTVDAVLNSYGPLDGRKLSHLTHAESPWRDARAGLSPTANSNEEITLEAMADYYGSLADTPGVTAVDDLSWAEWERAGGGD